MTNPSRGRLRVMRGMVLGALCALIALAGHAVGGGHATGLGAALAVLVVALLGTAIAKQELTLARLSVFAVGSQLLVHLMVAAAHHQHAQGGGRGFSAQSMVVGHVVAALFAAVMLRQADATVFRWARFLSQRIGPALVGDVLNNAQSFPDVAIEGIVQTGLVPTLPNKQWVQSATGLRGPPSLSVV